MTDKKKERTAHVDHDYRDEASRLAKLSARERKENLAVHWRIADDVTLSKITRAHARRVAEALERLLKAAKQSKR